jgi:DNA repair exonuclease SbcCD nuclease subunit
VERRRRGHDFLANHQAALAAAKGGRVDVVIHGGDLFHRSRVPQSLVYQGFRPLLDLAEAGIPVFVVPGNHERSRIPHDHLASHPNLHLFRHPGTKRLEIRGLRVAISGFPYERRHVRRRFPHLLRETGWACSAAHIRLLCMHHCVEGATVGPGSYTFRNAPDVVRCADLPRGFAAVLSGHIHRHQLLGDDLEGRPLAAPVLYPGSVERTAFAEMGEEKGFLQLRFGVGGAGGRLEASRFVRLPDRPMLVRDLHPPAARAGEWRSGELRAALVKALAESPGEAVLRLRIHGRVPHPLRATLRAAALRRMAPPEMNPEVVLMEDRSKDRPSRRPSRARQGPDPSQRFLDLGSLQG